MKALFKLTKKQKEKIVGFIAQRLVELQWGQFIVNKGQFIATLLILVQVYQIPKWLKIILLIIATAFLFISGALFNKHIRKEYQKRNYKGTLYKKTDDHEKIN
jgi:hypothetical protein